MDKLSKKLLRLFCLVFFFFPMKLHFLVLEELKRFSLGAILSFGKKSQLASNLKLTSTCTMTIYGEHGIMAHIPRWLSRSKHFVTPTLVSPQKCLRNKCRNSILMTQHYPDLGSAFNYWMKQIINQSENYPDLGRDMQYRISVLYSQTSCWGETSGGIAKCWLLYNEWQFKLQYRASDISRGHGAVKFR